MSKYELLYIVHPDLESSIDKITEKVKSFVEIRKGKITYEENWGKRKLAYEIKKSEVGIYVLVYFEAPTAALAKIERDLRLTEEIIRFMVLSTAEQVKKVAKAKKQTAVSEKTEEAKPVKEAKKAAKKPTAKKEEKGTKETEAARMKKLDEKLGALLGDEEPARSEDHSGGDAAKKPESK